MTAVSSYCEEWTGMLGPETVELEQLRRLCFRGELQGSRFRSVCWRLLLRCLPVEKSGWGPELRRARVDYMRDKAEMLAHGALHDPALDPRLNNPLSEEEESPWRQYFWDKDLRACIEQDVERTFPELEYFQSREVRTMMVDVLFVYGRANPHVAYKQGMHEILGPLIFVLFFDQQAFAHASEQNDLSGFQYYALLKELFDAQFLEADAYAMFCSIMSVIEPWYCAEERRLDEVQKLNWIGDELLRRADPKLYKHLETLEIAPQIYGLRWLRLLFGREFPIQDLLFLWDAIFADSADFLLVDAVFIAMLIFIRQKLLQSDYTGCLHFLMRYPPVADVHTLLALALHIRNPQTFPKPKAYAFMNFTHITVAGRPHPNRLNQAEEARIRAAEASQRSDAGQAAAAIARKMEKTGIRVLKGINKVNNIITENLKDITEQNGSSSTSSLVPSASFTTASDLPRRRASTSQPPNRPSPPPAPSPASRTPTRSRGGSDSGALSAEAASLVREQVHCLQRRVTEVEAVSKAAAMEVEKIAAGLRAGLGVEEAARRLDRIAGELSGRPPTPSSSPVGWVEVDAPHPTTRPLKDTNELKPLPSPSKKP